MFENSCLSFPGASVLLVPLERLPRGCRGRELGPEGGRDSHLSLVATFHAVVWLEAPAKDGASILSLPVPVQPASSKSSLTTSLTSPRTSVKPIHMIA